MAIFRRKRKVKVGLDQLTSKADGAIVNGNKRRRVNGSTIRKVGKIAAEVALTSLVAAGAAGAMSVARPAVFGAGARAARFAGARARYTIARLARRGARYASAYRFRNVVQGRQAWLKSRAYLKYRPRGMPARTFPTVLGRRGFAGRGTIPGNFAKRARYIYDMDL